MTASVTGHECACARKEKNGLYREGTRTLGYVGLSQDLSTTIGRILRALRRTCGEHWRNIRPGLEHTHASTQTHTHTHTHTSHTRCYTHDIDAHWLRWAAGLKREIKIDGQKKKPCSDSWSLSHLGYSYPGTTPVMIKLDHNRRCPWV